MIHLPLSRGGVVQQPLGQRLLLGSVDTAAIHDLTQSLHDSVIGSVKLAEKIVLRIGSSHLGDIGSTLDASVERASTCESMDCRLNLVVVTD